MKTLFRDLLAYVRFRIALIREHLREARLLLRLESQRAEQRRTLETIRQEAASLIAEQFKHPSSGAGPAEISLDEIEASNREIANIELRQRAILDNRLAKKARVHNVFIAAEDWEQPWDDEPGEAFLLRPAILKEESRTRVNREIRDSRRARSEFWVRIATPFLALLGAYVGARLKGK